MFKLKCLRKSLWLAALCALPLGCGETGTPASRTVTTNETPERVTANRPISTDPAPGAAQPGDTAGAPLDRTNTGVNVRDRESTAKTPFDQNENQTDIAITADIRKRVVDTKMSVNAQNVKIITQDGKVTLRGPVETLEEKAAIEKIAQDVAGDNRVENLLEVSQR
jgi:hyperosmotically inducible periplasmic protein